MIKFSAILSASNNSMLVDACLTSKQLPGQKTPETAVQLSFANQEGKLVGSIFSRPSGGSSQQAEQLGPVTAGNTPNTLFILHPKSYILLVFR